MNTRVKKTNKIWSILFISVLIVVAFLTGGGVGFLLKHKTAETNAPPLSHKNIHISFTLEVFDTIKKNYWEMMSDEVLINRYLLGMEKILNQPQALASTNRAGLEAVLTSALDQIENNEKKNLFVTELADIVLTNLSPFGRSRLYTQKDEKELSNRVKNISGVDHYQTLEVDKNASLEEISNAYDKAKDKLSLEAKTSTEAAYQLNQVSRAYHTLRNTNTREVYDQTGIEPTVVTDLIRPNILHLRLTKFSPTTVEDLEKATKAINSTDELDTLIFDLRDNVGGAIDSLPYLLGPFIGPDQYAHQYYHQGEITDYKTRTGWLASLVPYKKVVILINENTQSSAEVMATVLKRYNVGVVVGATTKGWGTVEKVFPLSTQLDQNIKQSVFLAHSLTLRDDGELIEGSGVDPLINWESPNWESQLNAHFNSPALIQALKEIQNAGS